MITDNDITYAESLVRKVREAIVVKRATATPAELKQFEDELALKERDLRDIKNRQRNEQDQERRDKEQKERDDRRKRLA